MSGQKRQQPTVFIAHPSDLMTDHLANGDGLVAYGFVRELATRGYRLHIATPAVALRESLPDNVVLYVIKKRFTHPMLARVHYMWSIRRLLKKIRKTEQIDLIHQMNPVFAGLSLGVIGCGLPVILGTFVARWPGGEIADEGRGRLSTLIRGAARWALTLLQQAHASVLMLTTPAAMGRIAAPGLMRRKTVIMRHGIDDVMFSPAHTPTSPLGAVPTILFYSHLDRRKGVFTLVEAFAEVRQKIPNARLVIVGRGEHEAALRRVIEASGCADAIDLNGPVPRDQAPTLMRSHNVYCLPSFGEPYATTVLEAMACGCPIVVTDAGGLPFMVPESGCLRVPPGDVPALAAALVSILASPALQARMGAINRMQIERHHTWRNIVDELEDIYARTAFGHRGVRHPASGKVTVL